MELTLGTKKASMMGRAERLKEALVGMNNEQVGTRNAKIKQKEHRKKRVLLTNSSLDVKYIS
jgi:hypothetical protein